MEYNKFKNISFVSIHQPGLWIQKLINMDKMNLIKKVLSARTKDELVEFLLGLASEYEEIKRCIELNFNIGNDEDEIKKSIAMMAGAIGD